MVKITEIEQISREVIPRLDGWRAFLFALILGALAMACAEYWKGKYLKMIEQENLKYMRYIKEEVLK